VQVPTEYVKNNEIVLNVGFEATTALKLGNEVIEFKARFGGKSLEIVVPVDHVIAIYARENGQGMAFPAPDASASPVADVDESGSVPSSGGPHLKLTESAPAPQSEPADAAEGPPPDEPPSPSRRPALKRVK
jgi:stringent starvation protein B